MRAESSPGQNTATSSSPRSNAISWSVASSNARTSSVSGASAPAESGAACAPLANGTRSQRRPVASSVSRA
jgi:hypothetical protein